MLVRKKKLGKKNLGEDNYGSETILGPKILGPTEFWIRKNLCLKNISATKLLIQKF